MKRNGLSGLQFTATGGQLDSVALSKVSFCLVLMVKGRKPFVK